MSDLVGNHIVGFPTRRLKSLEPNTHKKMGLLEIPELKGLYYLKHTFLIIVIKSLQQWQDVLTLCM